MGESISINYMNGVVIPPIPHILIELNKELQKDDPQLKNIAKYIRQDISLSASILKTVNSSFFSIRNEVTSIEHALNLLGMNMVVNIVMGLLLQKQFSNDSVKPPHFWDSPVNTALISAALATKYTSVSEDQAYLTGLFSNVGHSIIIQKFPDYYGFLEDKMNDPNQSVIEFEDAQFHFDHATVGYYLATSWGLNDITRKTIQHHHYVHSFLYQSNNQIDTDETLLLNESLSLLKMAEHIDNLFHGVQIDYEWERVKDDVLGYIGLSDIDFEDLIEDMLEKLESEAH